MPHAHSPIIIRWRRIILGIKFRFQLIGRIIGVHVHLGSFFGEKVFDALQIHRVLRAEIIRLHVSDDGLAHLSDNRHLAVRIQRHGGHHQPSALHVGFEQHTNLAAQEPCVDALYDRLEISRKFRKLHDLFAVHQVPPLHVAVVIRGEVPEERMVTFDVKPCGVGRTHLEPTRVPEHGRELLHDVLSISNLSGCRHQNLASCFQHLFGFLVQDVRDVHVAGVHTGQIIQRRLRIHPKVPMVPASHFFLAAIEVIRSLQHHLEYHCRGAPILSKETVTLPKPILLPKATSPLYRVPSVYVFPYLSQIR